MKERNLLLQKMAFSVGLSWDSPPRESVWRYVRMDVHRYVHMYADVRTKIPRINRLPNLLTSGAPQKELH